MNPAIASLLSAAARIAGGERLTTSLLADEGVPVDIRLLVAATALAAADQPVTKLSMVSSAPAARSAAYRDHSELMTRLIEVLPAFVDAQLQVTRRDVGVTELAASLMKANATIARERERRERAELELAHAVNYARELHWRLRPEYEAMMRERQEKVLPLRPVPGQAGDIPPPPEPDPGP